MLRAALVMTVAFVLLTLLGGRAEVGVLSGTFHSAGQALLGLAYAASWFGVLMLVPPLLIAHGARWLWGRRALRST